MKRLLSPGKLLAQTVAAVAIALFWCFSAVGTTVGTAVGVTTLATAVTGAISTPAEAGLSYRASAGRPSRRRRGRRWWGRCLGSVVV